MDGENRQQLINYIHQSLDTGIATADIENALLAAGWQAQDITDAFGAINSVTMIAIPVAPIPAQPSSPADDNAAEVARIETELQDELIRIQRRNRFSGRVKEAIGGLTGWIVTRQIAKDEQQATRILIGLATIFILLTGAILSSILFSSLNGARSKARDAKRISEIQSLETALELYNGTYGHYPVSSFCGSTIPNAGWCNSKETMFGGHWIHDHGGTNLSPYLSSDPTDPTPSATPNWTPQNGGTYFYYSLGNFYMIVYGLENYPSSLERSDGVSCGSTYDYGDGGANSGGTGILTVGVSC